MVAIGLVGGSSQQRALPFNAERTINLYAVTDPRGIATSALNGTPGVLSFGSAGTGATRGMFAASNGRAFVVSDSGLYETSLDGTTILRGTLDGSSGIVSIEENGFQLAVCDGSKVYIFTYLTNAFAKVTDLDLPPAATIDFIDGYFVINQVNSGKFYISNQYDGLNWNPLDFATAESSPDNLTRISNFAGYLGLFGSKTLELWRNTGDSVFPFSRVSGSTPIGTIAPYTVLSLDTSTYWVGNNDQGTGIVYKAQGFTPTRISTNAIELILQKVTQPELLRAWSYQKDGHVFYVITGADLPTTLVYDLSTEVWHERAFLAETGELQQHLGCCSMYAFNRILVGDRINGNIYELSETTYTDNLNYIPRIRRFTHLIDELDQIRYSQLRILLETGVGLQSGQGSNPLISLRLSKDGAETWSDYYHTPIGAVGKYGQEVNFRRLGISTTMTFELSSSEPIKHAWIASYLK